VNFKAKRLGREPAPPPCPLWFPQIKGLSGLRDHDKQWITQRVKKIAGSEDVTAEPEGHGDFRVEYAPSSRAECRGCHRNIAKGDIRLGKLMWADHYAFHGLAPAWHHLKCFFKRNHKEDWGVHSYTNFHVRCLLVAFPQLQPAPAIVGCCLQGYTDLRPETISELMKHTGEDRHPPKQIRNPASKEALKVWCPVLRGAVKGLWWCGG
jgi:hypothetical protein